MIEVNRPFHALVLVAAASACSSERESLTTATAEPYPPRDSSVVAPAPPKEEPEPVPVTRDGRPIVEISHAGTYGLVGTAKDVLLDVVLRNDADVARWFLLPKQLDHVRWLVPVEPRLQRTALHGAIGEVVLGRTAWDGGALNALKLAPRAEIKLRRLHHDIHAATLPKTVDYEIAIAAEVRVGGDRLEAWFDVDPTTPLEADVVDDRWQVGGDERGRYESTGPKVTFTPSNEVRVRLRVPLRGDLR